MQVNMQANMQIDMKAAAPLVRCAKR